MKRIVVTFTLEADDSFEPHQFETFIANEVQAMNAEVADLKLSSFTAVTEVIK